MRWAALLLLAAGATSAAAADDPLLWPEAQRAFLQDGPALLLPAEEREAFPELDAAERERRMREMLDRDPIPETPANEMREGIERRLRLAMLDFTSPQDARAQLVFLKGRPAERLIIDCAAAFKPLEVWTYREGAAARELVLYRQSPDEPFRLWLPIDSKRALYSSDMEYWMEQWEAMGRDGKRIDRFFCPNSDRVDSATGIDGLLGKPVGRITRSRTQPDGTAELKVVRDYRWVRPNDRAALLAAPRDLAAWAREAAATELPPEPPRLELGDLEVDFPRRQGQRLTFRGLLPLPSAAFMNVQVGDNGQPRVRLTVEGVLELGGRSFEHFRMRYQVAPPAVGAPAALLFERQLRPAQSFLLRLVIKDDVTGAETRLTRGFQVPSQPVTRIAAAATAAAMAGELLRPERATGPDTLLLMPPPGEVVLGLWRADTVVTGERIAKVVFLVDGEAQITRTRPPYSSEVRLARFPKEQVVRVEGYDAAGELVAADQVLLNQPRGGFKVLITSPARGAKPSGRVQARAEVMVPEEQKLEGVEFRVNDQVVATLKAPPWQHEIEVPPSGDTAYLSVVAILEDGTRTEGVRFLRAPANLDELEVDLVELFVTAADSSGRPVRGLAAEDFEVSDAGKPQKIAQFERVENLPLQLGIAIDTSFSMASDLTEAQRAAAGFLHNLVTPKDRCFALSFGGRPALLMPLVDDVEAVSLSLEGLRAYGRTALYDAVISSLYYFRGQRGQRALVVLTDGEDTGSSTSWEDALEYARRSGVTLYAIGLNVSGMNLDIRGKLSTLAESTGGRVFFIGKADELSGAYDQIEEELRNRYFLAYNADQPADENGLRQIDVRAKRGLKARVSRGYHP